MNAQAKSDETLHLPGSGGRTGPRARTHPGRVSTRLKTKGGAEERKLAGA